MNRKAIATLRYFEEYAPIGEWFKHDRFETAAALSLDTTKGLNSRIQKLMALGYMQMSDTKPGRRPYYRVVKPWVEPEEKKVERQVNRKIEASRDEVLAMLEGGMSQRAIAEHFGCSRTTVHWLLYPERYERQLDRNRVHKQLQHVPELPKPRKRQLIRYAGWDNSCAKW
jgi:hypothetical protein